MKMKRTIGYVVVNVKTGNFVDHDGTECPDSFDSYPNPTDPLEIIEEVNHYITHHNNKLSRKLALNRKHYKIGKIVVESCLTL